MRIKTVTIHYDEELHERKYALKKPDGSVVTWREVLERGIEAFEEDQNQERVKNL